MSRIIRAVLLLSFLLVTAQADGYDADVAEDWLLNLAGYLSGIPPLNDPTETGDLSRPGEYLLQYDFGTVITQGETEPKRGSIVEVTMETAKIADCLGHTVGMRIEDLNIPETQNPMFPLTLVSMQQTGIGWLWIYGNDGKTYGVEWVSYRMDGDQATEMVLTYTVAEDIITSIRIRRNKMTADEAMGNLSSVGELDETQRASSRAVRNNQPAFSAKDTTLNGTLIIAKPVDHLAGLLESPESTQTLPAGQGRLLLYDGLIISCNLEEQTGVETVYGVTAVKEKYTGPRAIQVGMTLSEILERFRCDRTVTTAGGTLYQDDADPENLCQGKLVCFDENEESLIYGCRVEGQGLWLEVTFQNERASGWRVYLDSQMANQPGNADFSGMQNDKEGMNLAFPSAPENSMQTDTESWIKEMDTVNATGRTDRGMKRIGTI